MPEPTKPPNAIPAGAFPTAPTQEERAKQGTPLKKVSDTSGKKTSK